MSVHPIPAKIRNFLRYDSETGKLFWIANTSQRDLIGREAGAVNDRGYVYVRFCRIQYTAGRIAYFLMTGAQADEVDHIDLNPSNNSWSNLRTATRGQNSSNRASWSGRKKGAYPTKGSKFIASIRHDGKAHYLGSFLTEDEAHAAYCAAAVKLHGPFARFN